MADDVLSVEDIAVANLVGGEEDVWEGSQQPPCRLTWTVPASLSLSLGVAEALSDFAVPYDLT